MVELVGGQERAQWLFNAGFITTKTRRGFERVYDLTERVMPRVILEAAHADDPEASGNWCGRVERDGRRDRGGPRRLFLMLKRDTAQASTASWSRKANWRR